MAAKSLQDSRYTLAYPLQPTTDRQSVGTLVSTGVTVDTCVVVGMLTTGNYTCATTTRPIQHLSAYCRLLRRYKQTTAATATATADATTVVTVVTYIIIIIIIFFNKMPPKRSKYTMAKISPNKLEQ